MKVSLSKIKAGLVCFLTIWFFACGGGGSGGEGSTDTLDLSMKYTGLSTLATITSDNATEIMAGTLNTGDNVMKHVPIMAVADPAENHEIQTQSIFKDFGEEVLSMVLVGGETSEGIYYLSATESDTEYGDCGGVAVSSITVNDEEASFAGTVTFEAFCNDSITIDGDAALTGIMDGDQIVEINLNVENLSVSTGDQTIRMDGLLEYYMDGNQLEIVENILVEDSTMGDVYKYENLTATSWVFGTYTTTSLSGNYYHPEYGYVQLSTPEPVVTYLLGGDWPESGVVMASGATGPLGGPTRAEIEFLPDGAYVVRADEDGDDSWDWESKVMYWE